MSSLTYIATEVAKPMVEHSLRNGATHLNTDFIGAQAAELAAAIEKHLHSVEGVNYSEERVCMKNIDTLIGKHVATIHSMLHQRTV